MKLLVVWENNTGVVKKGTSQPLTFNGKAEAKAWLLERTHKHEMDWQVGWRFCLRGFRPMRVVTEKDRKELKYP